MSCNDCEKCQDSGGPVYYIRIGTGNVAILGCKDHVSQLINIVRNNTS